MLLAMVANGGLVSAELAATFMDTTLKLDEYYGLFYDSVYSANDC